MDNLNCFSEQTGGQGAVLLTVIEEQSRNEIAVNALLIWGTTLLLTIISPRRFPLGGGEVKYKEANVIDFSAPSLYLHLAGKYIASSSCSSHEHMLAATILKAPMKKQLERKLEFVETNDVGNRT